MNNEVAASLVQYITEQATWNNHLAQCYHVVEVYEILQPQVTGKTVRVRYQPRKMTPDDRKQCTIIVTSVRNTIVTAVTDDCSHDYQATQ